ncbi:MAG: hypothetical protein ACI4LM_00550 [Anaerovoracaceae bacterium]
MAHSGFIFLSGRTGRVGKSHAAVVIPRLTAAISLFQGGQDVLVKSYAAAVISGLTAALSFCQDGQDVLVKAMPLL